MTGPKAAPKPAHAKDTTRNTELSGSRARKAAIREMPSMTVRATSMPRLPLKSHRRKSLPRSCEIEEEAARSWLSAVDMVAARIPARITPASRAGSTPNWLIRLAIRTMMVSESASCSSAPALVMALPTNPMVMATPIEITTHEEATRRESFSFFSSSMAIKRTKMWGMPK